MINFLILIHEASTKSREVLQSELCKYMTFHGFDTVMQVSVASLQTQFSFIESGAPEAVLRQISHKINGARSFRRSSFPLAFFPARPFPRRFSYR